MRRKTWASIDLVRKLRSLEQSILKKDTGDLGFDRAGVVLELMSEFSDALATSKVKTLEKHFVAAFARLARKEDMVVDVRIDPTTFAASLIDRHGKAIPKERLSAGEKQIYAIAMLEALGKASGRQLPVIIDTPLGRLDSHHRGNLVENYFPRASHQVIVLSTDTEVDEPFYQGMSRHISHAYHLVFDHVTGATKAEAGYFWKERRSEEEGPRAA
jgi:DNA sulfur modification protein DndD